MIPIAAQEEKEKIERILRRASRRIGGLNALGEDRTHDLRIMRPTLAVILFYRLSHQDSRTLPRDNRTHCTTLEEGSFAYLNSSTTIVSCMNIFLTYSSVPRLNF